jgi:hypothetical protein
MPSKDNSENDNSFMAALNFNDRHQSAWDTSSLSSCELFLFIFELYSFIFLKSLLNFVLEY